MRTNHHITPVALDSLMDRARAAGLRDGLISMGSSAPQPVTGRQGFSPARRAVMLLGRPGMDYDLTKKVLAALEREGVKYVVFGAVALALHGLPRTTEDLDIFIAPEKDNIERLKAALRSVFDDPCIDEITAEDLLGEYPAVQYVPPTGTFHLDVLTRLGELFEYTSMESERVDFDGISVCTVTPRMLYRMKKGTVRPKDWGDAQRRALRFGLKE